MQVRLYSDEAREASNKTDNYSKNSSGLMVFSNADKDKLAILNYVKGKAGIYLWTNQLNGKKYVGSSVVRRLSSKIFIYKKDSKKSFKQKIGYCDYENINLLYIPL